ncbi:acyl-ACP thioesterase [Rhizobium sp. RU36D]|uniref:acyl-ACP thioesterase n=1 Tax=Rhizobium sp. RU36D TaxID=1907415 RepID=UPI0009D7ADC1|nr:acyl-ACP thioesterase [Rhizobium sp. RU36D]SMC73135.1 acyl-CoA thioester hydrolase [Rhizobium sp. RU36D]
MSETMIEVWRGSVRQWELDEMGHWNTQFYAARFHEALVVLFGLSGMPGLYSPRSPSTLSYDESHIRFHREAHAGAPLHITGGFLGVEESTATIVLVMYHSVSGQVAATFRVRVSHVTAPEGTVTLPWPPAFTEAAASRRVDLPKEAQARSTGDDPVVMTAARHRAMELGLKRTAIGLIEQDACDAFGRMGLQKFIGAVGNGVKQLTGPLHAIVAENAVAPTGKIGGALLEFRILKGKTPRLGDCFEIWAGLQRADKRVMHLVFWMIDPITGTVFGSMQSVAVVFDIDRRGIIDISPAAEAALLPHLVAGLDL